MGAYFQETEIVASSEKDLREQYEEEVEYCLYMDGHGGYTGTFAEKPRFRIVRGMHDPIDREEAYQHCLEHNDKWGPSFAYYIGDNTWYVAGWCSS